MNQRNSFESNYEKDKISRNDCTQKDDDSLSQNEEDGRFSHQSMIMYIPFCAVAIFGMIVKGGDDMSLTVKIVSGYVCGFVVWIIAALAGFFDKKD